MKIRRCLFLFLAFTASLAVLALAGAAGRPAANHSYLAFVGTYTNKTDSKGIYAYEFDAETGTLTARGVAAETRDPSWLVIHPNGKFVYAANESGKQSTITAFSVDAKSAKLTQLNQLSAIGEDPCYLSFDRTGKFLFVANYTSGNVAVFPILPDGKLGEHTALVKDSGTLGPNKERQEGPHAHWVEPDGSNRSIYVADLGLDQVMSYPFDPAKGTLRDRPSIFRAATQPGTGPRHAILSRDGQLEFIYVLGELTSTVTFFGPGPRQVGINFRLSVPCHPVIPAGTMRRKLLFTPAEDGSISLTAAATASLSLRSIQKRESSARPAISLQVARSHATSPLIPRAASCSPKTSIPIPSWSSASTPPPAC